MAQTNEVTQEQIDRLEANWAADPCWDIEDTEGFESVRHLLVAIRDKWLAKWELERNQAILEKRLELACNRETAVYVLALEKRLDDYSEILYQLGDRVAKLESRHA